MPNPVEGLLEVYEDMVEVLLVLEIFLTEDSLGWRSALWCSFLLWNLPTLCDDLLRLWLQSLPCDLQRDLAWVADQADRSIFWHCCRLPFLGSVMTKDWVHGAGFSLVCQFLLQNVVWELWLRPLYLLGPLLLGCCRLQLIFLSSVIVLQPPFLCEGWVGRPLCLSEDSSVQMDLR